MVQYLQSEIAGQEHSLRRHSARYRPCPCHQDQLKWCSYDFFKHLRLNDSAQVKQLGTWKLHRKSKLKHLPLLLSKRLRGTRFSRTGVMWNNRGCLLQPQWVPFAVCIVDAPSAKYLIGSWVWCTYLSTKQKNTKVTGRHLSHRLPLKCKGSF